MPVPGPIDPFIESEVLPHLTMEFSSGSGGELLRTWHDWFERSRIRARTVVLLSEVDRRFQIDLVEACRLAGFPVTPGYPSVSLENLIGQVGVNAGNRRQFENEVLGPRRRQSTNCYHPNAIGGDNFQLAQAALHRGAVV